MPMTHGHKPLAPAVAVVAAAGLAAQAAQAAMVEDHHLGCTFTTLHLLTLKIPQ